MPAGGRPGAAFGRLQRAGGAPPAMASDSQVLNLLVRGVVNGVADGTFDCSESSTSSPSRRSPRSVVATHLPPPVGGSLKPFGPFGPGRVAGAAERRRMVMACRVLRTQILRFEEAFKESHGHVPKGAERMPLATTYAQYRSWKRYIRDDAAQHIQRAWKGRGRRGPQAAAKRALGASLAAVKEVWTAPAQPLQAASSSAMNVRSNSEEAALLERKRQVKAQLKAFDQQFYTAHGRLPKKAEKEPIRNLYEVYNGIKRDLEALRVGGSDGEGAAERYPAEAADEMDTETVLVTFEGRSMSAVELKKERKLLHRVLRDFEDEFKHRNGREVSCAEDIAPVAAEYSRYREIKRALREA